MNKNSVFPSHDLLYEKTVMNIFNENLHTVLLETLNIHETRWPYPPRNELAVYC